MANTGYSVVNVAKIKDVIKSQISLNFSGSLGREPDIINVVSSLIYRESSFNPNSVSSTKITGKNYLNSSAINAILTSPSLTGTQKANIEQGLVATGLMQVMGYSFVRKSNPSGTSELERIRPELAAPLMVNPGESIRDHILGEANIGKQILAGLIILEGKYRLPQWNSAGYFSIKQDAFNRRFKSRLEGAVAAYIGLGRMDGNGTTPESYIATIFGGDSYQRANGKGSIYIRNSEINVASTAGPSTNGSTMSTITNAGCG